MASCTLRGVSMRWRRVRSNAVGGHPSPRWSCLLVPGPRSAAADTVELSSEVLGSQCATQSEIQIVVVHGAGACRSFADVAVGASALIKGVGTPRTGVCVVFGPPRQVSALAFEHRSIRNSQRQNRISREVPEHTRTQAEHQHRENAARSASGAAFSMALDSATSI